MGRLAKRVSLAYVLLSVVLLLVLGLSINLTVRRHLLRGSVSRLQDEAAIVLAAYSELRPGEEIERLRQSILLRTAGRLLTAHFVIADPNWQVKITAIPAVFPQGSVLPENLVEQARRPARSWGNFSIDETQYLLMVAPLQGTARGWAILLADMSQLSAVLTDLNRLLVRSLGVALLAAVGTGLFFGNWLTAPLHHLRQQVARVARREYYRVEAKGSDELAELARSINDMAHSLEFFERKQREFFQDLSHELKTPLMSIQGYAEGIVDGVFSDEDRQRALEIISQESQRLKSLMEGLLYLSRMEDPSEPYSFQSLTVADVLEPAFDTVQAHARARNVVLHPTDQPDVGLRGDPVRLGRVFENLLTNAVRYARSGVWVSTRVSRGGVVVEVCDDGPGFAQSDLSGLFGRFHKGEGGQTGLGLAIAKTIVERHGGSITASNRTHGGAQITVTLPSA